MQKKTLRRDIINLRNSLSEAERIKKSVCIQEQIIDSKEFNEANIVLSYLAYNGEVNTELINKLCLKEQKDLYFPVVTDSSKSLMEFVLIRSTDEVKEGYKGILEPLITNESVFFSYTKAVENKKKILMIVPGVAFTKDCFRLGYGKGFYDRFLSDKSFINTIGLGFDIQVVNEVFAVDNDIQLKNIVTESSRYVK